MTLQPLPDEPGKTELSFRVKGFPEEEALKIQLERHYRGQAAAPREFSLYNQFDELIFSGAVDLSGNLVRLDAKDRRDSGRYLKPEE